MRLKLERGPARDGRGSGAERPAGPAARAAAERRVRRRNRMCAIAVGSALIGVLLYAGGVFGSLEDQSVSARFAVRGTQSIPFVFVGEDETSLDDICTSGTNSVAGCVNNIVPRRFDADVIDYLKASHARAIGVDLEFVNQTDTADDNALILASRNVVLATTSAGTGKFAGVAPVFGGCPTTAGCTPATARYTSFGAKVGMTLFALSTDGEIKSVPYEENGIRTFPVVLAEQATGRALSPAQFPGGSALIDYAGPAGTVETIPFVDVLCTEAPHAPAVAAAAGGLPLKTICSNPFTKVSPSTFAHKIVIVGSADPVLQDQHETPTTGSTPMFGAELLAQATNSVMNGNPLSDAPGVLDIVLIVAFGLVVPLVRLRLRPALTIAFAVALAAVYTVVVQLAFDGGLILTYVYPLIALALGTATANALDYLIERGHRESLETELARLPGDSSDFFISYRREQSSWPAGILRSALVARFGESSVFMDLDSISAGETWPMRIEEAIRSSNVMLVLIGPDWADARAADGTRRLADPGDWVRREVETGLVTPQCAVVPVLLDGARMPPAEALPQSLAALTHRNAFALSAANWDAELSQLLDSVQHGRIREFLARERAGAEQAPTEA